MEEPRFVQHQSVYGEWESIRARPDRRLRPYVLSYEGYREQQTHFGSRLEPPQRIAVLIINFGPAWTVEYPAIAFRGRFPLSFVAGLNDTPVLVSSAGPAHCLQVNFSPIGAYLLFGVPMSAITNRTVALEDLAGPDADRLEARLVDAPTWPMRFTILDHLFLDRLGRTAGPSPAVLEGWRRIAKTNGTLDIGALATDLGLSHKHLISRFREQIGLPPKAVSRIARLDYAIRLAKREPDPRWAEIALQSGYSDQSHLVREFQALAGCSPVELLRRQIPNDGGTVGDALPAR